MGASAHFWRACGTVYKILASNDDLHRRRKSPVAGQKGKLWS